MEQVHKRIGALIVKSLFQLRKSYPFPSHLAPDAINEEMFHPANMKLMSYIIHYLLNIINKDKCSSLVPHPLTSQYSNFNQGVMRFLNETFKELPHMRIEGLRVSTLATFCKERFEEFLAHLVTNTVHMVNEKLGVIPSLQEIDEDDRLCRMEAIRDRVIQELSQQRRRFSKSAIDISRSEEPLLKLRDDKEQLMIQYNEETLSCPPSYAAKMGHSDPAQDVQVLKDWENDVEKSCDELSRSYNVVQGVLAIAPTEFNILERENLLNSENKAIISKVAEAHNIRLFYGLALSLPGFLRCTSLISEKLNTLMMDTKLEDPICAQLQTYIDAASNMHLEVYNSNQSIEAEIQEWKTKCRELKDIYDDLVANGKIVHRYSYSRPIPNVDLNVRPQEPPLLPMSPGDSWKEELENVRRNCRAARPNVDVTPKLTRKKTNTSVNSLSRTVLQRQAGISMSRGTDSTVGEMFQGPLSSSSPVNSAGDHAHMQPRRSFADFSTDFSLVDAELNEFLHTSGLTESESGEMSPDDTFGDFQSQIPDSADAIAQPSISNPTPASELPKPACRIPRPSIDAICKRYAELRKKIGD